MKLIRRALATMTSALLVISAMASASAPAAEPTTAALQPERDDQDRSVDRNVRRARRQAPVAAVLTAACSLKTVYAGYARANSRCLAVSRH